MSLSTLEIELKLIFLPTPSSSPPTKPGLDAEACWLFSDGGLSEIEIDHDCLKRVTVRAGRKVYFSSLQSHTHTVTVAEKDKKKVVDKNWAGILKSFVSGENNEVKVGWIYKLVYLLLLQKKSSRACLASSGPPWQSISIFFRVENSFKSSPRSGGEEQCISWSPTHNGVD